MFKTSCHLLLEINALKKVVHVWFDLKISLEFVIYVIYFYKLRIVTICDYTSMMSLYEVP